MPRLVRILIWFLGAMLILLLGSWMAAKALLSESTKDKMLGKLSATVGVPVKVGSISIDFGQWLKLSPALTLRNVVVGNPPGFKTASLLEAAELQGQANLRSIFSGNPQIQRLAVIRPVVTVERSAAGVTNLELLVKNLGRKDPKAAAANTPAEGGGSLTIDEFTIV